MPDICEYEDCDELALRDTEYCIYHEPDKTGLAARGFYKLIRQEARDPEGEIVEDEDGEEHRRWVFEDEVDWEGYRFPRIPRKEDSGSQVFLFEYVVFEEMLRLEDAHFESSALFWSAEFRGVAYLDRAYLNQFIETDCYKGNSTEINCFT